MTLADRNSLREWAKRQPEPAFAEATITNWLRSATPNMRALALGNMSWYDMADFAGLRAV